MGERWEPGDRAVCVDAREYFGFAEPKRPELTEGCEYRVVEVKPTMKPLPDGFSHVPGSYGVALVLEGVRHPCNPDGSYDAVRFAKRSQEEREASRELTEG